MVTRFRVGSNRPPERLNLLVFTVSPLPKSYTDVFNDPNWQNAMHDEYNALTKNNIWILVPRPTDANIVRCVDVDETFSPVVKPATIRIVLSLATSRHWHVHQLAVKNALLHGDLSKTIIALLNQEFSMTDLGSLNYFMGISVVLDSSGMFLSQRQYATEIIERAIDHGLQLYSSSTTSLVAYSDANWACCPTTKRSTSGNCVFLGNNLLSCAEAEYGVVANVVAETCWLRNLLRSSSFSSRYQYADIFTNDLSFALFEEFRNILIVRCPPAQTVMEC
ncbi:ribonuclease H-like domain-containing protein [Tanacetum coccineum]|uniref:Ribonuclease H-like domain-containing protein n=1 Tax=Tanacetum coccineum TaxID=301880 RepID=A0ABQ5DIB0_9ASTR